MLLESIKLGHRPKPCTVPSGGPEMLATQLIDCSSKVKTKQNDFPTVSREGWTSKIVSQPEQAKLRGVVSRAGIAVALVSCRLQHHSPDRGELR